MISGIDHVAITVADIDVSTAFYRELFAMNLSTEYRPADRVLVRQVAIGTVLLSIHQEGNGLGLVARNPLPGSADICFRWSGRIETAVDLLRSRGIAIVEGPVPRRTADGRAASSVYFRDPDHNLIELMAADR